MPLVVLVGLGLPLAAAPEDDADEKTLRAQKVATDGPGLLAFFRSATPDEADRKTVAALIQQLGSRAFADREKASAALCRYGPRALPLLQEGARSPNAEIARRSRRCLEQIAARSGPDLYLAALRLLIRRRPEEAAEVLLRYLPFADDACVQEQVLDTLADLALRDGQADPAILKAASDELPLRRVAAARALGQAKDARLRAPVRALLADPDARVRLEAAQALLLAQEKEAVPVLIGLLRAPSADLAYQAEGLLLQAAGHKAPKTSAGDGSAAARKGWHDAWASWWQAGGAGLDLARVARGEKKRGLVLVAEDSGAQQVWEFGPDRKERWHLTGVGLPMDVRPLPGGTFLIANFGAQNGSPGVVELDKTGKVVWQKAINGTVAAQRLANGNTFICTDAQLLEVDRAGTTIVTHSPGSGLTDGVRLANGNVVFINTRGVLKEITWPARQDVRMLRLSNAPPQGTDWYRLEPQPGARLLLASHTDGRVFEIDAGGKVVWEHRVPQAYAATRLANGNVLIGTAESMRLIEVERSGRIVHEAKALAVVRRVRAY
jgi:HEAT repeat protein